MLPAPNSGPDLFPAWFQPRHRTQLYNCTIALLGSKPRAHNIIMLCVVCTTQEYAITAVCPTSGQRSRHVCPVWRSYEAFCEFRARLLAETQTACGGQETGSQSAKGLQGQGGRRRRGTQTMRVAARLTHPPPHSAHHNIAVLLTPQSAPRARQVPLLRRGCVASCVHVI